MGHDHQHVLRRRPVLRGCQLGGHLAHQRRRRQVVQLRQVGAAVPVFYQLSQLRHAPAVAAIAPLELRHVKPRLEAADKHVQRAGQKLLPQRGISLRLQGRRQHVVRPDGDAVAGVGRPVHRRIGVVHLAVLHPGRFRHEHEGAIGVRPFDGAPQHRLQIVPVGGGKARPVVAGREGDQHQLVGVGLHGVAQSGVRPGVLIELQLVQMDEHGIERVEQVGLVGQRLHVQEAAAQLTGELVSQGAVQHPQRHACRIVRRGQPQPHQVVLEELKALHALLHGARHRFFLGAAALVPQAHGKQQRFRKAGLYGFPRGEDVRLRKPPQPRVGPLKAAHRVGAVYMPRHQFKELAPQRRAVQPLPLHEREQLRHDPDAKLRQRRIQHEPRILQITQKPLAAQPRQLADALIRSRSPGVSQHLVQMGRPHPPPTTS